MPKASAVRRTVPTFPGSWTFSSTTTRFSSSAVGSGRIRTVNGCGQIAYPTHLDRDGNLWQTNADEAFYLHTVTEDGAHGSIEVSKLTQGANDDLSFEIYG